MVGRNLFSLAPKGIDLMNGALLQNTLLLGTSATLLAGLASVAVLLLSLVLPQRWARWIPVLAGINLLLPQFLMISVWLDCFRVFGAIPGVGQNWYYSMPGAVILLMLLHWPIGYFLLWARRRTLIRSMLLIDPFLGGIDFLKLLATALKRPLLWGMLFVFALSVNNLAVPGILQVRVLPEEVFVRFNTEMNLGAVSRLSLPFVLIAGFLSVLLMRTELGRHREGVSHPFPFFRERLGTPLMGLVGVVSCVVFLFGLAVPLGRLVGTPETWNHLLATARASQRAIGFSILFAGLSASLVLGLGLLSSRMRWPRLFWGGLIIPGTLLGAHLAVANNWLYAAGVDLGWGVVLIGVGFRYLGLGVSGGDLALKGVDPRWSEMASLEGIPAGRCFWLVLWPSAGRSILVLWWILYILCLWEVEILIFLIPPGVETLGLSIFNLLHYGHNSQVYSSCLLLILMGLLPALLYSVLKRGTQIVRRFGAAGGLVVMALGATAMGCRGREDLEPQLESQLFSHAEVVGSKGTGVGQFNKPRSLVVDERDEVFVVDMTGRVQRFSASGDYISFWQMPETERGRPKGMGLDADGYVIVVEPHYARINHYSVEGQLITQWGVTGRGAGQLAFPRSVGVLSDGDLIVSEFQQVERLQRFRGGNHEFVLQFGEAGGGIGAFNRPEGIGISPDNRIFVADSCNHRIQVFDEEGRPLAQYGRPGNELGELSYPYDIRIDEKGFQYVCEFGNSRIQVFGPDHQPLEIIGKPGLAPGEFSNPWSIDLDSQGHLWVADSGNHRIQKLVRRSEKE